MHGGRNCLDARSRPIHNDLITCLFSGVAWTESAAGLDTLLKTCSAMTVLINPAAQIGNAGRRARREGPENGAKNKEQRTCVRCSLACTLPQVLRQTECWLLKRRRCGGARGRDCARRRTDNGIFKGAEVPSAGLVQGQRGSQNAVRRYNGTDDRAATDCERERVAALGSSRKRAIDEATAAGRWHASCTGRATKIRQGCGEAKVGISSVVRDFSCVDAT